ncbi:MAG: TIGR00730 family Rossman fold protein [Bauldia sp.]|nr:TIGR00730 family Rossman fold protein [Bauldia sp.]
MKLSRVCVYCGSSEGVDPDYAAATIDFGRRMAEAGIALVYGGGAVGLMGILARSVMENGGTVTGIIPGFLRDREVMLREATELVVTDDMHQRKRLMFDRSDAFVALPGGIGTLEETVEMMTWAQLGQHAKPVVLANIKGFWDPLTTLLRHMEAQGFVRKPFLGGAPAELYTVVSEVAAILPTVARLVELLPEPLPSAAGPAALM